MNYPGMPKTGILNRVGAILSNMFITKLIIAFAGIVPLTPATNTIPLPAAPVVIAVESQALEDQEHCYDVVVAYEGTQVTVSACGDTPQRALNRLGAAVRRLNQSQE